MQLSTKAIQEYKHHGLKSNSRGRIKTTIEDDFKVGDSKISSRFFFSYLSIFYLVGGGE